MRKYFLISAVALMAATSANATTDYAEVTAKATIEVANTFTCPNLDWGTIVVKQQNDDIIIVSESGSDSDDLISYSGTGKTECNIDVMNDYGETISLKNSSGDTINILIQSEYSESPSLISTITIPANVKAGEYTGLFTVTKTY